MNASPKDLAAAFRIAIAEADLGESFLELLGDRDSEKNIALAEKLAARTRELIEAVHEDSLSEKDVAP